MKARKKHMIVIGIVLIALVLVITFLAIYNQISLKMEADKIVPNGQLVDLGDYSVHVYSEGENDNAPTLVFLAGAGTVAPTYDFKSLYSLLSDEYKIAVVEKAGYGYSDIVEVNRDVDTMVNEVRNALVGANIGAPYMLLPHSMSGLEAIYWAQNFPDEIAGIIGLDMAVPQSYDDFNFKRSNQMMTWGGFSAKLGLLRVPGVYPLNKISLSDDEVKQQKLLMYRNAVNLDYVNEVENVYENAQVVKAGQNISCPIILFSSNGSDMDIEWLIAQREYAKENDAMLMIYDCGHYLHYNRSGTMANEIRAFVAKI